MSDCCPSNVRVVQVAGTVTPPLATLPSDCIDLSGSGIVGDPLIAVPILDPDPCNALVCTASGLLVPASAVLVDSTPNCLPTGTEDSVLLTATPDPACPGNVTLAAQLAPCFGITRLAAAYSIPPQPHNVYGDTGLFVDLPEAGCYDLDADVRTSINVDSPTPGTVITVRLFNVTAGTPLVGSERNAIQIADTPDPGFTQVAHSQTCPIQEQICVTGPTRIRLEAKPICGGDTLCSNVNSLTIGVGGVGQTSLRWTKIAD